MKTNSLLLGALLIAFSSPDLLAETIHVSLTGNDENEGTEESPLLTLRAARLAARRLRECGSFPAEGITVLVHGGRYELDEPLRFSPEDSGRPGAPIVYAAAPGDTVVVSGGRRITGWRRNEEGTWQAPAGGLFRQLYVDGRRAIRARTPDAPEEYDRLIDWDTESMTALVPLETVAGLERAAGAEFVLQTIWSQVVLRIESIRLEQEGARITFPNPERTWIFNRKYPGITGGQAFHLENHPALLDAPGEWYHDLEAGVILYRPRPGEDLATAVVTVPRLETLVRIEGSALRPVEELTFRGLSFEESNWLRPSRIGVQGVQAGMFTLFASLDNTQILGRPPAAVEVSGARHLRFERNRFRNLGATGLDLRRATAECEVIGNVFEEIAGGPIRQGTFSPPDQDHHFAYLPDDLREVCTDDRISNNVITRCALDYPGNCAIACGFVRGVRIEHNTITHMPYTGISVGWGWNSAPNAMADNRIRYNRIDRVMELLVDGGAIYTLSPQRDSEVSFNFITNVRQSKWTATGHSAFGIYFDEASDYIHRHHNVLRNIHKYFAQNRNGDHIEKGVGFTYGPDQALSEEARGIADRAGIEPAFADLLEGR